MGQRPNDLGRTTGPGHTSISKQQALRDQDVVNAAADTAKIIEDSPIIVGNMREADAFMIYAMYCGDIERTAYALALPKLLVFDLAKKYDWFEKIGPILALKKEEMNTGDIERAVIRNRNFLQAHTVRRIIDSVIHDMGSKTQAELMEMLYIERLDKNLNVIGRTFSTKPITDLVSAMEKLHWMCYQSVCDSVQERMKRRETGEDKDETVTDIHAAISKAMANLGKENDPGALEAEGLKEDADHIAKLLGVRPAPEVVPPEAPLTTDCQSDTKP